MNKIVMYVHHGEEVYVRENLIGKHREYCLCYRCRRFKPGADDNCTKAQQLYQFNVENGMVTPVWECPTFAEV